ncbi:DUF928 domain-containing protein [Nostoc sp. FACHB-280]|uniref:DUF928 domain-containing protein n=1 Tax=Nostoc sp. FACHB-280 TaxID=2692839 RepID=UPI001F549751|nr:DUF928 domain-containing protein [Nostoc sp. FACHB-280]
MSKKPPIKPRKTGSRNPNSADDNFVCMVSPDLPNSTRVIWSNRPLFIWQGKIQKIVVRNKSNGNEWTRYITENQNTTTYTERQPLQPGQNYEWQVFFKDNLSIEVNFKVMEMQQRDRITANITTLEKQLKAQGKDAEAIAIAKANYFAENQLWSDVLQQIYSIDKPSPELDKFRQELSENLCKL